MYERAARILVGLIALTGLGLGLWAAFDPRGFYLNFPGGGRHWVSADGPYNEHLVRDFGALNLGLVAVALVALWRPFRELLIAVALANLAFDIPHLVYHLRHLDLYDTSDKIANVVSLSAGLLLPVLLLALAIRGDRTRARPQRASTDPLRASV
jgi:hypothetical protein